MLALLISVLSSIYTSSSGILFLITGSKIIICLFLMLTIILFFLLFSQEICRCSHFQAMILSASFCNWRQYIVQHCTGIYKDRYNIIVPYRDAFCNESFPQIVVLAWFWYPQFGVRMLDCSIFWKALNSILQLMFT